MAEHWIQKIEKKSVSFNFEGMEKKSLDNADNRNDLAEKPNLDSFLQIRSSQYSENRMELNAKPVSAKKELSENQSDNNG